jgi:hypothetical protein
LASLCPPSSSVYSSSCPSAAGNAFRNSSIECSLCGGVEPSARGRLGRPSGLRAVGFWPMQSPPACWPPDQIHGDDTAVTVLPLCEGRPRPAGFGLCPGRSHRLSAAKTICSRVRSGERGPLWLQDRCVRGRRRESQRQGWCSPAGRWPIAGFPIAISPMRRPLVGRGIWRDVRGALGVAQGRIDVADLNRSMCYTGGITACWCRLSAGMACCFHGRYLGGVIDGTVSRDQRLLSQIRGFAAMVLYAHRAGAKDAHCSLCGLALAGPPHSGADHERQRWRALPAATFGSRNQAPQSSS